ncbi:glycosyltransferase family 25 protein [Catenovulum maritimum]|uniref:Glycosyl transferase family 25 domain-containing protein n=1 Tax=Catenovulum maritimum TaxID=1513271 RepID=A0A0J8GSC7_9ALTE|nr:glycosyltransferase family 25 protein [Catenovulum maritimum]KMT65705.1 hypothetical protein XM47_08420 [Catenovulum maritimum]
MLETYIINLSSSLDRWQHIRGRLDDLKITYNRFEAVDGRSKAHPLFSRYNDKLRLKYRSGKLSGGELGCFASHYLLWKKCVELDKPLLILEDDIRITEQLKTAIQISEKYISRLGYIRLAGIEPSKGKLSSIKSLGEFEFLEHSQGPSGTQAYVISPTTAQILIDNATSWYLPVDVYMDRYWSHGVRCISLMPYPIELADFESNMLRSSLANKTIKIKLNRELTRLKEQIYRFVIRQKYIFKSHTSKIS